MGRHHRHLVQQDSATDCVSAVLRKHTRYYAVHVIQHLFLSSILLVRLNGWLCMPYPNAQPKFYLAFSEMNPPFSLIGRYSIHLLN